MAQKLAIANCKHKMMGVDMMPLTFAIPGELNIIKKVGGNPEVKRHLENLGFVTGTAITVINTIGGNMIVSVRDSRVAISSEMAKKIII